MQDAARCAGYELVKCGTRTVTDAVACGTHWGESGTYCGKQTITDGARCGWDTVGSCLSGIFTKGSTDDCKKAKSCEVPASCNKIPNQCTVDVSCSVPKTCEVPKSCEQVKTCEQHSIIPDFDYGSVRGTVEIIIGDSGLKGYVSGEFCPTSGSCVTVAGGHLDLGTGAPRACIQVPNIPGEFCAAF